jgi:Ferric iron reductase FhuF-like transporter
MRLEKADHGLWEYAERYLGVGTRRYSSFSDDSEISERYDPRRGAVTFDLRSYVVPDGAGSFVTSSLPSSLIDRYRDGVSFLLPVHPDTYERLDDTSREVLRGLDAGPTVSVTPSANGRTVFVYAIDGQPVERHFLKLHFPGRLSRFTRRLRQPIIRLQIWVAEELVRIGCPVLPEVGGGFLGDDPTQAWGYLIREALPIGASRPDFLVPVFALYGKDAHASTDSTLLEQLVDRSGEPALDYIGDRVVRPMVRMWLAAAQQAGLTLETHGQNTLFGFSEDGRDTVVIYRDGGIYVDPAIRSHRGLTREMPPVNVISRDVTLPADQVRSLAYDSFMGHHVLSLIAGLARERFDVPQAELQDVARDEFGQCNDGTAPLPATVYYYDDQLHPDGNWTLVDTETKPEWR